MKRPKKSIDDQSTSKKVKIELQLDTTKYTHLIGLDPGLRLTFGGVTQNNTTKSMDRIKLKSSTVRHECGDVYRLKLHKKWTHAVLRECAITASPKNINEYIQWTAESLKYLTRTQKVFCHRKVSR